MSDILVGKVAMVPLSSITVGERARKEMGDLDDLECSLKECGLITPLAVYEEGNGYVLLAGERRFRVLERNQVELVPVRIYPSDITEIERLVIEKSENFFRKDFEYYEYDALVSEIHRLQLEIHGERAPGPGQEGWRVADTGDMVGISQGHVSTALKRAEAREAFPELFEKCKSQSDANKLIKKLDEAAIKQVIADKLERSKPNSTLNQMAKCYIIQDFFEGAKQIPNGIMHLVEIDPPYGIDLNEIKKSDGESQYTKSDYNEVPSSDYQVFLAKTFAECYRVMADHSWLICWFAPEPWFEIVYQELHSAGFNTSRMCGIWTKSSGQSMRPEMYLANAYEMFFYAWKGRPALNKPGRTNIFNTPPVLAQHKTHPTERPVELMKEVYETFAFPGSRVLIPFLGSGNGIIAANALGMSPVGFDLSKSFRDSFLVKIHGI